MHILKGKRRQCLLLALCLCMGGLLSAQDSTLQRLRRNLATAPDSSSYVDALNRLGTYCYLSNTDSCFWYAVRARDIATRLEYDAGIAGALNNLAIFFALKANMKQAIEYDYKALQLYRALVDSGNICQLLGNISIFYAYDGMVQEGNSYLYQALDVGSRLSNDSMYSLELINYVIRFNEDSARQDSVKWALRKAKQILEKYPHSRERYYIAAFEADELLKRGQPALAEQRVNALAEAALKRGLVYVAIEMYEHAETYARKRDPAAAIHYTEKMYGLGMKAGYTDLMLPSLASLFRHYAKQGNAARTAHYGNSILGQAYRQLQLRNDQRINYMDYFLKEQELKELQLRNQVQQQTLEKQRLARKNRRLLTGLLGAVLLLLTGFTVLRYRAYRNLRKQEQLLAQMNAAISEKNEQLRANDDFKNKLISIIAHDFREPLSNIINISTLFRNREAGRETVLQMMAQVETASARTLAVFDNILRWIKSQLSGFVYAPAPCQLQPMLEAAMHSIESLARSKQVMLLLQAPEQVQVAGDREMLQFVHRGLLQAALALSPGGAHITITVTAEAEEVKTGIAVPASLPPETAARLFGYHNGGQGDDTALMLIICKDFIAKMGGRIWAESTEKQAAGKPARHLIFYYTLPSFH